MNDSSFTIDKGRQNQEFEASRQSFFASPKPAADNLVDKRIAARVEHKKS